MRIHLNSLLVVLQAELNKAKDDFELAKKSAQEISASASASPSQSGDRFHAQGTMDLTRQKLDSYKKLKQQLEEAIDLPAPIKVTAPCCVKTQNMEFFLVNEVVAVKNMKLVSLNTPLGLQMLGKKVGDVVLGFKILEIN